MIASLTGKEKLIHPWVVVWHSRNRGFPLPGLNPKPGGKKRQDLECHSSLHPAWIRRPSPQQRYETSNLTSAVRLKTNAIRNCRELKDRHLLLRPSPAMKTSSYFSLSAKDSGVLETNVRCDTTVRHQLRRFRQSEQIPLHVLSKTFNLFAASAGTGGEETLEVTSDHGLVYESCRKPWSPDCSLSAALVELLHRVWNILVGFPSLPVSWCSSECRSSWSFTHLPSKHAGLQISSRVLLNAFKITVQYWVVTLK